MLTSVNNPLVKAVAKLQNAKYRTASKQFIVEGEHLVLEAEKHGLIDRVFVTENHPNYQNATLVSEHVMKKMTDTKHPPRIMALVNIKERPAKKERVLILETVQDPGNVGTLIRSASAFGFDTIVLDKSADVYSPKVVRATQGALFNVSIVVMSVHQFTKEFPHIPLIATNVTDEKSSNQVPKPPFALVLGNEGAGVSDLVKSKAVLHMHIPTQNVESLNVAVAGSILMHALGTTNPQGFFKG